MEKRLVRLLLDESEKVIETVEMDITREMDKKFPDYTDSERTSVREKHKRFKQNLEIRRNKKWEKFKKREQTQEQVEIINLKVPLSNLQKTAVNITSNVEQPPGEKRIKAEKRDSNRKSYEQVLMNTSTATERISDTNSRFSF